MGYKSKQTISGDEKKINDMKKRSKREIDIKKKNQRVQDAEDLTG